MDPLTIYAGAQATIAGIKGAIAMGKDINGLIGDFSKFFSMADQVHVASTRKKIESIKKSDSQIAAEALQIAWASKKLREDERYLKDMLIWSGNDDVYYEMIKERTRMAKERAEAERLEEERKQKEKEKMAEYVMTAMYVVGISVVISTFVMLGVQVYGLIEENNQYEMKKAKHARIVKEQQYVRSLEQKN
jgi:hypothetical protein